ncbi:hypothetical protein H4R27_000068 [Coemansia aciculifera]|nr:hypothetical protein H4R27_000068 [Coemansia aciculifera]
MDAKDQPTGLGTVAEGSERKPGSNASRGRGGGRRGGANSTRPPADPNRTIGGDEGAPRSSRRKPARPPPPTPPLQTPLSPPISRGNSSMDLGPAGRSPPLQRPPPPHPRGGGRPPRPITPKNRPVNSPAPGGAPLVAGSVGSNPVAGGGGGPRPYRPRPPRPVRPIHNVAAAGKVPAISDTTAFHPVNNSAEHARPVKPIKESLPPHVAQPRPKPRPDLAAGAANARVRPKHKPAGKSAVAVVAGPSDTTTTGAPSFATSVLVATEDLSAPAIMPRPPHKTPNKPKPGPRESPKKKGAANYAQGKGVSPLAKAENGTLDTPTRNNSMVTEANDSTGPASQSQQILQQLPPPPKSVERKPVTKVTIRWLPVDLPEHVFWKSVEPALPWFDPQHVGVVVQKECLVLRGLKSDLEAITADIEATANTEPEATPDQGSVPKDEAETECDPQAPLAAADDMPSLSLGATTTVMVDVYESGNLSRLDSEPYWRAFVPGKQHQSRAKPADPSRAYILFATPAEVDHFYRHYHGHIFSKNGTVSRAAVELAAFQHVPWSVGISAGDMLSGTIDEDPDFIAFLAMDPNAIADATAGDGVAAAGTKPLSHVSYAAAASSSTNGGSEGDAKGAKETTTPLINYLRELKSKASGARSANRSAAHGKPAATATSSPAKTPTSAPSRSGDVTPKKPRRRNR